MWWLFFRGGNRGEREVLLMVFNFVFVGIDMKEDIFFFVDIVIW